MSHNPNRVEDRNSALDRGFKPTTWRHSVHPQRQLGVVARIHAALAPDAMSTVSAPLHGLPPVVASQQGHEQRIERIKAMHQMHAQLGNIALT